MVGYSYMQQQQAGNLSRKRKYTTTDDGTITTGGTGNANTTTPVNDKSTSATSNNNDSTATATTASGTPTKVPRLSTSATTNLLNTLPKSHLHSFAQDNSALCIMDIPPHVTDAQLVYALSYHITTTNADGSGNNSGNGILHLFSSPVVSGPCEVIAGEDEDVQKREDEEGGMGSSTGVGTGEEVNGLSMEGQKNREKNSGYAKIIRKEHGLLYFRTAWAIFDSEASKVCFIS